MRARILYLRFNDILREKSMCNPYYYPFFSIFIAIFIGGYRTIHYSPLSYSFNYRIRVDKMMALIIQGDNEFYENYPLRFRYNVPLRAIITREHLTNRVFISISGYRPSSNSASIRTTPRCIPPYDAYIDYAVTFHAKNDETQLQHVHKYVPLYACCLYIDNVRCRTVCT